MIFKHSLNNILRSPGKSLLFLILLSASITFISLGVSMNYSANRMLSQADEHYKTVIAFKYGDLHNPDGAWADENFQKNIATLDFDSLTNHPAVISYDLERTIGAFPLDGSEIWQTSSPVKNLAVFSVRLISENEDGSWQGVSQTSYYSKILSGNNYMTIRPYSSTGVDISNQLNPGRTLLMLAQLDLTPSSLFIATPIQATLLTENPDPNLEDLPEVIDISDQANFFDSKAGQALSELIEVLTVIDKSFKVVASSDIPSMAALHMTETYLIDGEFSEAESIPNCYLSERIAQAFDLHPGDHWNLAFHYDPNGNPLHSYSAENDFINQDGCRIGGILHISTDITQTIFMTFPDWLDKAPDDYDFLRVRVQNDQADNYLFYASQQIPQMVGLQVEDQGYATAVVPILKLRERSLYMTVASAAAGVAVICLFAYLFILRQRETADVMMKLGTGRSKTISYLVFGIMIIAILAATLGIILTTQLDTKVTEAVWETLQGGVMQDLRFSERALGLQIVFKPEMQTAPWVRYASAGAVVVFVFIITFIASLLTLKKPKRKKSTPILAPKIESSNAMAFAWMPGLSLRFASRSIKRNFLNSLIVPLAVALLGVFILIIGVSAAEQDQAAETIYDRLPTTAYMTTILGQNRQIPLRFQTDIWRLLDNQVQSRQDWMMWAYPATGKQIRDVREGLEAENPAIKEVLLTKYLYYDYIGLVEHADGSLGMPNLPVENAPLVNSSGTALSMGFQWKIYLVKRKPAIAFTDSITRTSEAIKFRDSEISWLEGYSDDDFHRPEQFVVLPDRLMKESGISLGDTVRLGIFVPDEKFDVQDAVHDFKVIGSYFQGSSSPIVYAPWNLLTEIQIGQERLAVAAITSDWEYETVWSEGLPNEYLIENVDSATIIPQDVRNLDSLRDYLEENQYSFVGKIRRNRLVVVIEDKALADGILSIQQHLSFLNFIIPIMLLLSGLIAFILSYLLTRNRLPEFAVMRSLGAKKIQVYLAFFLEQLFLLLVGFLPIAITLLLKPEWLPIVQNNLLQFLAVYTLGIVIAIALMGRSKVLDILFTKE